MELRRTNKPVNLVTRDDGSKTMSGYAAVFYRADEADTQFQLWEDVVERILPTAFDKAISEKHDARGLFNHDASLVLGRVSAETMRLSTDSVGLRYEIDLPDTQTGRDVAALLERGDIDGSSFAFVPTGVNYRSEDGVDVREISNLDLYDCGPVTYPAYAATTAGMRSDAIREELAEVRAKREREKQVAARIRQLEVAARVDSLTMEG